MNGQELMEGMSFVDEELLEEASRPFRTAAPRKKLLVAAACLALVLGAAAVVQKSPIPGAGNTEGISGSQTDQAAATEAAATEAAPVCGTTLVVRVETILDEGFTASVVASGKNSGFSAGERLEIRLDGAAYDRAQNHTNAKREDLWYRVTVDRIEDGIVYVTEAVELPESERRN